MSFACSTFNTSSQEPAQFGCGIDANATMAPVTSHRSSAFCSDPNIVKYVRLAFHFIQTNDENATHNSTPCGNPTTLSAPGNFTAYSDGLGDFNYTGYDHAKAVVERVNEHLALNHDHRRKTPGVSYPSTPQEINLQFVISGVFFHENNSWWNNGYNISTNPFDFGGQEIIDIYVVPYIEYPNGDKPGGFVRGGLGANNKWTVISGYSIYAGCQSYAVSYMGGLLNHELGHTLNLNHTWNRNDECIDTPRGFLYLDDNCNTQEANCYKRDPNLCPCSQPGAPKPCDLYSKVSNNRMDYNAAFYLQAYTSCQINRIQLNLNDNDNYIHSCNDCLPATSFFTVENTCLYSYQDRNGQWHTSGVQINANGSFNVDEWFLEICELDANGNCTTNNYTSPWEDDEPGRMLLTNQFTFAPNKDYRIRLTTNQTACPLNETFEQDITVISCSTTTTNADLNVVVSPTVFSTSVNMSYTTTHEGYLNVYAVNTSTGISFNLLTDHLVISGGTFNESINTNGLPSGSYQMAALFAGTVVTETIIKY